MLGQMQDWPLTVDKILDHAAAWHGDREVVTRSLEGPMVRTNWRDMRERAKRFSSALAALGVNPGDRVATMAWNTARHIEAWYAVMGMGAVCHTLQSQALPRPAVCSIINHAEDKVLIVDATFLPMLAEHRAKMESVKHVIVLGEEPLVRGSAMPDALASESLIATASADFAWGGFDENTACGLCYTSENHRQSPRACSIRTAPTSCMPW